MTLVFTTKRIRREPDDVGDLKDPPNRLGPILVNPSASPEGGVQTQNVS